MSTVKDLFKEVSIKNIRELYFSLNEEFYIEDPNKVINVELYQSTGVNEESKMVKFILGVFLHYENSNNKLIEIKVSNEFFIPNLLNYKRQNGIALPGAFLYLIVNESIAHCRALLARNVAATPFEQILIPLGDPMKIAQRFFPSLVKKKDEEYLKSQG